MPPLRGSRGKRLPVLSPKGAAVNSQGRKPLDWTRSPLPKSLPYPFGGRRGAKSAFAAGIVAVALLLFLVGIRLCEPNETAEDNAIERNGLLPGVAMNEEERG